MTTIYDDIFPLGLGTNRFLISGLSDEAGREGAVRLVTRALESGVSYVDVAHTYSRGMAVAVCREAFSRTNAPRHVTVKSSFRIDKTADDALRRVEETIKTFSLDRAFAFVCWNIGSYDEFLKITEKGALYDGAVRARECGLVDHITFSTHAPPDDIIRILKTEAFAGVTLSFSALNAPAMKQVLAAAQELNVGVVVMNPLGGD